MNLGFKNESTISTTLNKKSELMILIKTDKTSEPKH